MSFPGSKTEQVSTRSLRFWTQYLLQDYPAYLAFREGGRTGNYELCLAALCVLAPIFVDTGKTTYQRLGHVPSCESDKDDG